MAQKKTGGSSRNGRDSKSKRLGIKINNDKFITKGQIILRQRGTKFKNGINVKIGRDHTLFSTINGYVKFKKKIINVSVTKQEQNT